MKGPAGPCEGTAPLQGRERSVSGRGNPALVQVVSCVGSGAFLWFSIFIPHSCSGGILPSEGEDGDHRRLYRGLATRPAAGALVKKARRVERPDAHDGSQCP